MARKPYRKWTAGELKRLSSLHADGLTPEEIGKELGIDKGAVKNGIDWHCKRTPRERTGLVLRSREYHVVGVMRGGKESVIVSFNGKKAAEDSQTWAAAHAPFLERFVTVKVECGNGETLRSYKGGARQPA